MKRLTISICALVCLLSLLAGCGKKDDALALPEKAPADFAIRFSYWFVSERANIYDTYNLTLQKDLVLNGTASANLSVADDALTQIYRKITELEIDKITEAMVSANLTTTDAMLYVMPNTEYEIIFTIDGTTYTVTGDASAWEYIKENVSAAHFCEFADFMRAVYQNTEEYKALPEAEGGYD